MILVIPYQDENDNIVVSHGVDTDTLENVVLPFEDYYDFCVANCTRTPEGHVIKESRENDDRKNN